MSVENEEGRAVMKEQSKRRKLQQLLADLQQELSQAEADSRETADALEKLKKDVNQAMRELSQAEERGSAFDHLPLGGPLKEALTRFETTHPRLTGVINNILNVLAGSGV